MSVLNGLQEKEEKNMIDVFRQKIDLKVHIKLHKETFYNRSIFKKV